MRRVRWLVWFVILWSCASAWAQDYTITGGGVTYEATPSDIHVLLNLGRYEVESVNLPFEFPYYGRLFSKVWINRSGFVQFTAGTGFGGGQSSSPQSLPRTDAADGIVAARWTQYGPASTSEKVGWWVRGTAPNRRFVVAWDTVPSTQVGPTFTFQVQLYESTGRIAFGYATGTGGGGSAFLCGLDAYGGPGELRYVVPENNNTNNSGYPAQSYQFNPRKATYTGQVLWDRIVSDMTGIGNTIAANQPASGMRLELRSAAGAAVNATTTGADGSFSIDALGVSSSSTGTATLVADDAACHVVTAVGNAPTSFDVATNLSYATGSDLGSIVVTETNDAGAVFRSSLNVARMCLEGFGWASARTTDAIPAIDVLVDPSSPQPTDYYSPVGQAPARLRIGTSTSGNSDVWDDAIIVRIYGRHVLASIAGPPAPVPDSRFDAVTDEQNAFAEAFGYYLWAAVSGASQAIDGTGVSAATPYDLESPTISVTKGPDVAACVAGALYDLLDPANEATDAIDGSAAQDRAFRVVDAMTVAPKAATFLSKWIDLGYEADSLTRTFIGNHVLLDDGLEPNDGLVEAASLGSVGVRRSALVLNRFNEDWLSVNLPTAATSLRADVAFDGVRPDADVALEIRDSGGTLVASGLPTSATGPLRASTGPVAAGAYRIGVLHRSGEAVPNYTVQAYLPLALAQTPLRDWTVGQVYDQALGVANGIEPYTLSSGAAGMPPGLLLSSFTRHAVGTPTAAGSYAVTVQVTDGGSPSNLVVRNQTVRINEPLQIQIPRYVGFQLGVALDVTLPSHGGTAPLLFSKSGGDLPAGLSFDVNSLRIIGTASVQGSSNLSLEGIDVAGSVDQVATRGVVSVALDGKNVAAELAAGDASCGWWFDAVQGSTVSFSIKTARGRVKRALAGVVLGADRALVEGKTKLKLGGVNGSKLVLPRSGRCYVIASAVDGDATQLVANVGVVLPRSAKAKLVDFAETDSTRIEIGALPGAKLTLKFAGDKRQGLTARVDAVIDSRGAQVVFANSITMKGVGGTLSMDLPTGGTWTVVLAATSQTSNAGKLAWSYAVRQPKGVAYTSD